MSGWASTFTGAEVFVAPAIIGVVVFISAWGRLQAAQV